MVMFELVAKGPQQSLRDSFSRGEARLSNDAAHPPQAARGMMAFSLSPSARFWRRRS